MMFEVLRVKGGVVVCWDATAIRVGLATSSLFDFQSTSPRLLILHLLQNCIYSLAIS